MKVHTWYSTRHVFLEEYFFEDNFRYMGVSVWFSYSLLHMDFRKWLDFSVQSVCTYYNNSSRKKLNMLICVLKVGPTANIHTNFFEISRIAYNYLCCLHRNFIFLTLCISKILSIHEDVVNCTPHGHSQGEWLEQILF